MTRQLRFGLLSAYVVTVGTFATVGAASADAAPARCGVCVDTWQQCADYLLEACITYGYCDDNSFCCPGQIQAICDR